MAKVITLDKKELTPKEIQERASLVPEQAPFLLIYFDKEEGLYQTRYRGLNPELVLFCSAVLSRMQRSIFNMEDG